MAITCQPRLVLTALPGVPVARPGDDLAELVCAGLARAKLALADSDVIVVASTLVSRVEGRFVDMSAVEPGDEARALAARVGRDPRLVELILGESVRVSRAAPGVLIVRHRLGFVSANAGIDQSNAVPPGAPPGSGPWALLIPQDPDGTARALAAALHQRLGARAGVIVSDSLGRPFRQGTVGAAVGVASVPALHDQRGARDLFGRELLHTVTALADQIAAAADLVAGQADEGRPLVHVRGVCFDADAAASASALVRAAEKDLYL